jgi:Ca2+-binding EF-hand superfamily protein
MNHKPLILSACLLATGAVLAQAVPADDRHEGRQEQRRERAEAQFAESDSNHDGRIGKSEWQAARLREANARFAEIDLNRDGNLSKEEMQQARPRHMGEGHGGGMHGKLRAMDTDGDQQFSRAEIGDKLPRLAADFDRIDANRDGKLSREEIRASRPARDDAQRDDAQR